MSEIDPTEMGRYRRQTAFAPLALAGQRRLRRARAVIVGVGGLGTWTAELLARAGVGFLRLIDDDCVELENLHRQGLYDEADAAERRPKVDAAAARLRHVNSAVEVEPLEQRLDATNVQRLTDGTDLILDGTDNFLTRFVLNDYAVKARRPWVFAGVVAAEGQVMAFRPPKPPCLRCLYDAPPPPCQDPSCGVAGVLGPAVATLSALQAAEAMKILSGHGEQVSPYLTKLDLWTNRFQRIAAESAASVDCECCRGGHYEYLET